MFKHVFAARAAAAVLVFAVHGAAQAPASSGEVKASPGEVKAPSTAASPPFVGLAPPPSPLRIESPNASIQFGLLAQPQLELAGAPDADFTTKNLFLRRIRFMVGGTLLSHFEYFFDVDYPDLFKVDPANQSGGTGKNAPGLNVQDAFVSFKPASDVLKVDAGFMLPPLSHNALQGAGTLYSVDYFVNSFRRNVLSNLDPFGSSGQSPAGRDLGLQLRGLLFGGHAEYRVGAFQGVRVGPLPTMGTAPGIVAGNNFFRVAARLQINVLDSEPGYFYQGTYLGTKKVLSFGAFYDFEDQYKSRGVDALLDLPLGPGIVTAQANFLQWDGGSFIQTLPKATAIMAEAGYLVAPIMLSPIVRVEKLAFSQPTAASPSESRYGGGVAFWPYGHNSNVKVFFAKVHREPAPHDFNQVNLQWQIYFY